MKPTIFFAIPCGGFYDEQRKIIDSVCEYAGIDRNHRIIIEEDNLTAELWEKIRDNIERANFFMADISSGRANIVLELGYALKAKHESYIALFISSHATILTILSDLGGKYRFQYSSMASFRRNLKKWLEDVVFSERGRLSGLNTDSITIEEHFKDFDNFLKLWRIPSRCQFKLTSEGLRFSNTYYPILSSTLGLLQDYEFKFKARIEREAIGWVVKGTIDYQIDSPIFGVMFQLSAKGEFKCQILCSWTRDQKLDYFPRNARGEPTGLDLEKRQEFEVTTECKGDKFSVEIHDTNSGKTWTWYRNLAQDEILGEYYKSIEKKQGQVGFRCAGWREGEWGEVATVNWLRIREIDSSDTTGK